MLLKLVRLGGTFKRLLSLNVLFQITFIFKIPLFFQEIEVSFADYLDFYLTT